MRMKSMVCVFALALVPALAAAAPIPHYNSNSTGTIANTTVDLIPNATTVSGTVLGIQCVFPSGTSVGEDRVSFIVDAGTTRTFNITGLNYPQESNGTGQWFTGWIPLNVPFTTSIHVTLDNTPQGSLPDTVNCFISWETN